MLMLCALILMALVLTAFAMSDQGQKVDAPLEKMTTVELTMWLQSKGFGAAVQTAFEGAYILAVSVCLLASVIVFNVSQVDCVFVRTRNGW